MTEIGKNCRWCKGWVAGGFIPQKQHEESCLQNPSNAMPDDEPQSERGESDMAARAQSVKRGTRRKVDPRIPAPIDFAKRSTSSEDTLAIIDGMVSRNMTTLLEARVYLLIAVHGPRTLAQIVKELGAPFSTVSRVVWNMHDALGLVDYERHDTDRRKKLIVLRG